MTSPTSSMPSANSTRANGRSFDASIACEQVARRQLAKALELDQLLARSGDRSRPPFDQAALLQQRDLLLTEALDVHRSARDEVLEQLPRAPGTVAIGALGEDTVLAA